MLAEDLALGLDPVRLLRRLVPEPDDWQARVLRSTAPRLLLNCARQVGKSTAAGALAAHVAAYEPGALVLCLSPGERQSAELHRKVKAGMAALRVGVAEREVDNVLSTELSNGSRIVALPGREDRIRGFSGATLLLADEASRIPDTLIAAARPMLSVSRGRLIAMSTPFGRRGWWWAAWESTDQEWERYTIAADQCPRHDADFLAEERRALGPDLYAQEYGCRFIDPEANLFTEGAIAALFQTDAQPAFPLRATA